MDERDEGRKSGLWLMWAMKAEGLVRKWMEAVGRKLDEGRKTELRRVWGMKAEGLAWRCKVKGR